MSSSKRTLEDVHLDGDEENDISISGVTSDDLEEGEEHIGDVAIENSTYATGVDSVEAETTGSIQVPLRSQETTKAVENSSIGQITGDLSGIVALEESEIDFVHGDVHFGDAAARNTHGTTFFGDIIKETSGKRFEAVFKESNMPTVIGDRVEAGKLELNSVGGLIVTEDLDVSDAEEADMFTVAPRSSTNRADSTFPTYLDRDLDSSEWEEFRQEVKDRQDEIYGIPILTPDSIGAETLSEREKLDEIIENRDSVTRRVSFRDNFFAKEKYLSNILDEELDVDPKEAMDDIAERIGNIKSFKELDNRRYASLLNNVLQARSSELEDLDSFDEILGGGYISGLDEESRSELFERLETGDFIDIATRMDYSLKNVLKKEVETLMTGKAGTPNVSDLKEDWEESQAWHNGYTSLGGMLEDAIDQNEEELANLTYIADFIGEDLDLETIEWVEEQKERKSEGMEYEIEGVENIEDALSEEIEDKQRQLTLEALENLGKQDSVPVISGEYRFTPFLTSEKEGNGFIEFTGDEEQWDEFTEKLENLSLERIKSKTNGKIHYSTNEDQLSEDFFGIPLLEPGIDQVDSWDDFQKIENDSQEAIYAEFDNPESKFGDIAGELNTVFDYDFLDPRHKAQLLSKLVEDTANEDDVKGREVTDFGSTLYRMDEEAKKQVADILKTETDYAVVEGGVNEHGQEIDYSDGEGKFGNHLFDIAVNREYSFFVEDEADRIESLIESRGDLPETDPFFEEDSPYREIVEKLTSEDQLENGVDSEYGGMVDQELAEKLRMVTGLGERLGFEYDASSVFGMLKGKEGQRQNTDFQPDEDEIESLLADRREELEKDVNNKLREYVKQGIQNLGFEAAVDEYEEATSERKDELDENELAALKIRKRFNGNKIKTVDKLLTHQNDVYQLEENQKWLEKHGFEEEELIDPDLSDQADEQYSEAEDYDHDSALRVDIDPDNVEMNTEQEKQRYWEELTGILGDLGVEDEVEDIDQAEETIESMESEEGDDLYKEAKDVLDNYNSVDNRESGVPDELTLRVSDPMDTTQMGRGFGSCHDIDGGTFAWASVSNAVDANKMVFYAEDEKGRERARVKAFITEDEEMVYHNTSQYKDVDVDTSEYFEGYMSKVADNLGLDLKHSSEVESLRRDVELLEAHDWYSDS